MLFRQGVPVARDLDGEGMRPKEPYVGILEADSDSVRQTLRYRLLKLVGFLHCCYLRGAARPETTRLVFAVLQKELVAVASAH